VLYASVEFCKLCILIVMLCSGAPRNFFRGGGGKPGIFSGEGVRQEFFRGVSTNSVEDRQQRERGSGGRSPLVRGSTQFANE
jgi:hypothetical protein